jgi:UMF1 family MFS transporter
VVDNKPPMNKRQRRVVVAWSLYDWANSSFYTVVNTFIFATYFVNVIAENTIVGTTQWGYTLTIASIIVAVASPIGGSLADATGYHKRWLAGFTALAVVSSGLLWFAYPDAHYASLTLALVALGMIGTEMGMVFYNAMLPHIAPPSAIGRISGWAWGLGYWGGLMCLVIALLAFVEGQPGWLNSDTYEQIRINGPLVALWFGLFALPLFIWVPERPSRLPHTVMQTIAHSMRQLMGTLREIRQKPNLLRYLIAHMFYTDGLNTLFQFGAIYAAGTFGMSISQVIAFGIAMNVTAGLGAAIFAWMDDYVGSKPTILLSLGALIGLAIVLLIIDSQALFWVFGLLLSLFFGPVQAASRTLLVKLVPTDDNLNRYFGLYALSGKATAFIGPWLLGTVTLLSNSQRVGMATILLFFITGGLLLLTVKSR